MIGHYKRDIVEDAQAIMNANRSTENKNLISSLCNEIVALRTEIERLEKERLKTAKGVQSLSVHFDISGKVDRIESTRYE